MSTSASASVHRSEARDKRVSLRMSTSERLELKARAAAEGCSVNTYLLRRGLGRDDIDDLPPGPVRPATQGALVPD